MTKMRVFVIGGIFPIAIACSSSGGAGTTANRGGDSGGGGLPAGGSSGGPSPGDTSDSDGGGTGGDAGSRCVLPSCIENLAPSCVGTGTCATMTNLETDDYNTCFPNGVVESAVIDQTSGNTTLTVKQSSTTCFVTTFNYNQAWSGTGSITVVDASGKTVATVRMERHGQPAKPRHVHGVSGSSARLELRERVAHLCADGLEVQRGGMLTVALALPGDENAIASPG